MHRDPLATILPYGGMPIGNASAHENILRTIGWTPLVRLQRMTQGLAPAVYVKVESSNPGGSVKDRVA
ncbi:MAG: pyridoxal-phosphate dependent enzyme, partial [Gemmataceae bacterium]|nr:pyridoxal-phosphate dependent enzyme [Gemmataceae bacterium]